jgi:hypothetical protein
MKWPIVLRINERLNVINAHSIGESEILCPIFIEKYAAAIMYIM